MRLLTLAAFVTVVFFLFYRSGVNSGRDAGPQSLQGFYQKTMNAMDGRHGKEQVVLDTQTGSRAGTIPADKDADGDVDEDDAKAGQQMQERLKAAEQEAKEKANSKAGLRPDPPSNVVGVGSSAEGQKKGALDNAAAAPVKEESKVVAESKEARDAKAEINLILKKSPGKALIPPLSTEFTD
jgi:hypothetical protein